MEESRDEIMWGPGDEIMTVDQTTLAFSLVVKRQKYIDRGIYSHFLSPPFLYIHFFFFFLN